jgi:hypothetical protein
MLGDTTMTFETINNIKMNKPLSVTINGAHVTIKKNGTKYLSIHSENTSYCNLTTRAVILKLTKGLDYSNSEVLFG